MQLAVLQYCCLLLAIMLFAVRTPGSTFYHQLGGSPQICGLPVASKPAAICSVYCHMLHMQPLCSQMQPTGSQMHPRRCPISACMLPCGQPNSTICNHMQRFLQYAAYVAPLLPNAAHRQPNPPGQPCGQPASSHADTKQHPKCSNASMQLWKEDYGGRRQGR